MLTIVLTRSFSGVILETGSYFSTASSTHRNHPFVSDPGHTAYYISLTRDCGLP